MAVLLHSPLQHTYLALGIVFLVLTAFVTAIRVWSRWLSRARFGLDDWLALAALAFYWGEVAVHLWSMLAGGVGRHKDQVPAEQLTLSLKSLTIVEYPYTAALTCIRISLAWLMKRIFIQRWFSWCVYGIIFLNIAWLLFIYFDAALICRPFAYNWDTSIEGGTCGDKPESYIVMAVWGIFIDVVTWSLPLFVIWNLNSSKGKKLELSSLFALGLFDIAVSVVRIVQLENLDFQGDFSYTLAPVEIWSFIEAGVAIIIGNMPSCRQAIVHVFSRSSKSRGSTRQRQYVFSANRSKRGNGQSGIPGEDELQLWPNPETANYSAGVVPDDKEMAHELTPSSTSYDGSESNKDAKSINITTEVWQTSQAPLGHQMGQAI